MQYKVGYTIIINKNSNSKIRRVSRGNCAPVQTYDTQMFYYYYLRQEDYDYTTDSSKILL